MANRTPLAIAIVIAAVVLTLFLVTPIGVLVSGVFIGSEENIDFIPGANMGITAVADPTSDVVRVTFNAADATSTAAHASSTISDVGPGCSTGACLTDSATTTGGTLLVWEGTTDDGFDITFTITSDPATSSVFNFEAVADHEWSPITGDFTIGDNDEGQIQLGSLTIGKANDVVSTTVTDGIAFFYNDAVSLAEDISFIFLGPAGIPRFVLAVEGPDLATYNPRSLLIGPAATFANVDENVICSTNFNDIDCDTGATGADLGVQDDVEIGGDLFLSFDCTGNALGGALTIATTSGIVTCSDDDDGSATSTPGGSDTHIQFNDGGAFGGNAGFTFASSTNQVAITSGSAGVTSTGGTLLTIETDSAAFINFLTPGGIGQNAGILVGNPSSSEIAGVIYNNDNDRWQITANIGVSSYYFTGTDALIFAQPSTIRTTSGDLTFNPAGFDIVYPDNITASFGTGLDSQISYNGTSTIWDLQNVGIGSLLIALAGSFPSPDLGAVHIWGGTAGNTAAAADASLIVEAPDHAIIQLLAPDASTFSGLNWGNPAGGPARARIRWDEAEDALKIFFVGSERLFHSPGAFAFQEATTISTTAGNLTFSPSADLDVGANAIFSGTDAVVNTSVDGFRLSSAGNIHADTRGSFIFNIDSNNNNVATAQLGIRADGDSSNLFEFREDGLLIMGTDTFIQHDTNAGLIASTTQSQGAGPLTTEINEISVVGTTNDVVTLPEAATGRRVLVINNGTNTVQVFPASGDNLGAGINISGELEANEAAEVVAYDNTNWRVSASTETRHAEMVDFDNTDAFGVSVANNAHVYHTNGMTASDLAGYTFDAGGAGTSIAVASIADGGGGEIAVTTGAAHGLAVDDIISISNTSDANYDTIFIVNTITNATIFEVTATFGATATGTMDQAAVLTANTGSAGSYLVNWAASATSATNNEVFDFAIYIGATRQNTTNVRRKFGTAGDIGSLSGVSIIDVASLDKISFMIINTDSAGDMTIRNLAIVLTRL